MNTSKVYIFAPLDTMTESHRQLERDGCEVIVGKANWDNPRGNSESEIIERAMGCDALAGTSIRSTPITRRILESSERLRIVAKFTVGVDDVDVEAATALGILVTHSPTEANCGGVAEGTIAMMLTMLKKCRERDRHLKEGGLWRDAGLQGTYIGSRSDGYRGITIGLIGLGRIGSRIAALMRPWQANIIACDPYISESRFTEQGVQRVDLPTLLAKADVVSLHVLLTHETRHLIGAAQLAMMKPTATLINTSRGACVDEAALVQALQDNRIAGAALDVFEDEPLSLASPLRRLGDKVLLSPHMVTSNAASGLKTGALWAMQSVHHALHGEVPDNVYNKEVIPDWIKRFGGRSVLRQQEMNQQESLS